MTTVEVDFKTLTIPPIPNSTNEILIVNHSNETECFYAFKFFDDVLSFGCRDFDKSENAEYGIINVIRKTPLS